MPDTATPPEGQRWALVVPVKRLARAKTRLTAVAGALRPQLALAFAADTVRAALDCPVVDGVIVVTDEPSAAAELAALGARVTGDRPDAGLNAALLHGASEATRHHPGTGLGALSADLPALRPEELGWALAAAAAYDTAFVADATGSGTTLLLARAGVVLRPAFGPGSRAAHRALGAVELAVAGMASVRRDVDTPADLADALRLGVGPRTRAILATLPDPCCSVMRSRVRRMQGTVRRFDPATGSGSVLLDDGTELPYDDAAFAASGLRLLRLGQRVRIRVDDDGSRIVHLTLVTLPDVTQ
jgi:2-phospho-L-lactate/phosphoenolpyruvate guanylyltransferase